MTFLKSAVTIAAFSAFCGIAQAQDSGAYINVGVDTVEFNALTLGGKIGYDLNKYIAVEGQASFGIIDESVDGFDVGIDSSFGGFLKLGTDISEQVNIFVRGGYHFTQVGVDSDFGFGNDISASLDTDGFALGAGGEYFFTNTDGVRLEYTYFDISEDGIDAGGNIVSLSYVRKF